MEENGNSAKQLSFRYTLNVKSSETTSENSFPLFQGQFFWLVCFFIANSFIASDKFSSIT